MSANTDPKQQLRERQARYDQAEERKEKRRAASSARSREHKMITTASRLTEHTLAELIIIAQMRCRESGVDYDTYRDGIEATLALLHGGSS
jgi:hypothetical protein